MHYDRVRFLRRKSELQWESNSIRRLSVHITAGFSPLCFGKGCIVNELGKLSETEWENILLPSVYSSTHTLNWPIVPFQHLGKKGGRRILLSLFDIWLGILHAWTISLEKNRREVLLWPLNQGFLGLIWTATWLPRLHINHVSGPLIQCPLKRVQGYF